MNMQSSIGIYGLGTMGANLALNLASRGISVSGFNRHQDKVDAFIARAKVELESIFSQSIYGTSDIKSFWKSLSVPRVVLLMVPASAVDLAIEDLLPFLAHGDIVIDGGNSHFLDTDRRLNSLLSKGIHYIGMGISGGEEGARNGPSMMPGGQFDAWDQVRPLLTPAAAKCPHGEKCIDWLGSGGAGHFVKMTHNGIEYGMMQAIAEVYDLMHHAMGLPHEQIADIFSRWSRGSIGSYLIEITADILLKKDDEQGDLIDVISDIAGQKGTGRWTSEAALELGIPTPSIDAAVIAREISNFTAVRNDIITATGAAVSTVDTKLNEISESTLEKALYATFVITYAQGFHLLRKASDFYQYGLDLATVSRIWGGGCIIRSNLLVSITTALEEAPIESHIMTNRFFAEKVSNTQNELRRLVLFGISKGIPMPVMGASLGYYDSFCRERLPTNLIQAQRDYFGAHTYRRIDREGIFHTQWNH